MRKRPDLAARNKERLKNYDGMRFGYYTVIKRDHCDENGIYWFLCKCDCGKEFFVKRNLLKATKSCGCRKRENYYKFTNRTHGGTYTRLYGIWKGMKQRCYIKSSAEYKNYGGRGIKICDEWKNDFAKFREWAYENGYDDKLGKFECTIDRKDPNKDYEPENCKWSNMKEQGNNRTNSRYLTLDGKTHTVAEWSDITGIKRNTLYTRIYNGLSDEDVLTKEVANNTTEKILDNLLLLMKNNEYITKGDVEGIMYSEHISVYLNELRKRGYKISRHIMYRYSVDGKKTRYSAYRLDGD